MPQRQAQTPIRLVIDLDGEGDPIAGRLVEPSDHASSFRGWLALTALIEAVRNPAPPCDDPRE